MLNLPQESDNFTKYYTQKKQRIDLYLDMNTQKIVGLTKLTFEAKNEIISEIPEFLNLYLNAENINVNYVKIQKNFKNEKYYHDNIGRGGRGGGHKNISQEQNLISLEFKNSSPNDYKNYLNELYENIEDLESFKNLNRVEWETRQKGNLSIKIPKNFIIDKNIEIDNSINTNKNYENLDKNLINNENQNSLNKNNNKL